MQLQSVLLHNRYSKNKIERNLPKHDLNKLIEIKFIDISLFICSTIVLKLQVYNMTLIGF